MTRSHLSLVASAVFVAAVIAAWFFPEELQYTRRGVQEGELWRLLTAHFVHTNLQHLTINLVAAILIYLLALKRMRAAAIALAMVVNSVVISLYLFVLHPDLQWYNGLSALLHSLFVIGCFFIVGLRQPWYWTGIALVWLKVGIEQYHSPAGYFSSQLEINVITSAHFAGAILGTVYGVLLFLLIKRKGS